MKRAPRTPPKRTPKPSSTREAAAALPEAAPVTPVPTAAPVSGSPPDQGAVSPAPGRARSPEPQPPRPARTATAPLRLETHSYEYDRMAGARPGLAMPVMVPVMNIDQYEDDPDLPATWATPEARVLALGEAVVEDGLLTVTPLGRLTIEHHRVRRALERLDYLELSGETEAETARVQGQILLDELRRIEREHDALIGALGAAEAGQQASGPADEAAGSAPLPEAGGPEAERAALTPLPAEDLPGEEAPNPSPGDPPAGDIPPEAECIPAPDAAPEDGAKEGVEEARPVDEARPTGAPESEALEESAVTGPELDEAPVQVLAAPTEGPDAPGAEPESLAITARTEGEGAPSEPEAPEPEAPEPEVPEPTPPEVEAPEPEVAPPAALEPEIPELLQEAAAFPEGGEHEDEPSTPVTKTEEAAEGGRYHLDNARERRRKRRSHLREDYRWIQSEVTPSALETAPRPPAASVSESGPPPTPESPSGPAQTPPAATAPEAAPVLSSPAPGSSAPVPAAPVPAAPVVATPQAAQPSPEAVPQVAARAPERPAAAAPGSAAPRAVIRPPSPSTAVSGAPGRPPVPASAGTASASAQGAGARPPGTPPMPAPAAPTRPGQAAAPPAPPQLTTRQKLQRQRHLAGVERLIVEYLQQRPTHISTAGQLIAVITDDTSLDEMIYDGEVTDAIFSLASQGKVIIARDRRIHLANNLKPR